MFGMNHLHIIFFPGQEVNGATFLSFLEYDIHASKQESVCACVCVCYLYFPPNPPFLPVAKCWNVPIWNMTLSHWKERKKKKKKNLTVSVLLRYPPFHGHAHKSSACNAWTMSAALRLIIRMLITRIALAAFVLFIQTSQCSASNGTVCPQAFLSDIFCIWDIYLLCPLLQVCVSTCLGTDIFFHYRMVVRTTASMNNAYTEWWYDIVTSQINCFKHANLVLAKN